MNPRPSKAIHFPAPSADASSDGSAYAAALQFNRRQRQTALCVVSLAFVMDLLDTTIVNIAVPSIQESLHASAAAMEWIIGGYALALSLLLITGGRLGDTYGYKITFLGGVSAFACASLVCGIAWSPLSIVVARLFQGMAAAMMVPQVLALMQIMYPPGERIKVQAMFGLMGGSAAALGPVLGAFIIRSNLFGLGWRPIFLVNLPVSLVALWAGKTALPAGRSTHPLPPDLVGAAILTCILFLFMFPLFEGNTLGWPWYLWLSMGLAVLLLPGFTRYLRWQHARSGAPLLMPELFHDRAFSLGLVVSFFVGVTVSGWVLFFTLYTQIGLGFGVLKAGLYGSPFAIGILFSLALLGRRLVPLLGKQMVPVGATLLGASMLVLALLLPEKPPGAGFAYWIAIPELTAGLGFGTYLAAMSPIILSNVEVRFAGIAAGVMNSTQQLCGAFGVAVVGGLFIGLLARGVERQVSKASPRLLHATTYSGGNVPSHLDDYLRACSYHELRLISPPSNVAAVACDAEPSSTLGNTMQAEIIRQSADVRTGTFRWAFRWTVACELALLGTAALLSFALPKHLKVFAPAVHG